MNRRIYYLIILFSIIFITGCRRSNPNARREKPGHNQERREDRTRKEEYPSTDIYEWSNVEIERANTAIHADYLTEEEKKVIFLCNLARLDGKKFANTIAKPYLGEKNSEYISSLYHDLGKSKNKKMIVPNDKLTLAARYHAIDMGENGQTGHSSSDGTSMGNRVRKWYSNSTYLGENCDYGYDEALDIVMHLLVDEGVESLGHRENILNPEFSKIGVSIQPHKAYRFNCVQDFSN